MRSHAFIHKANGFGCTGATGYYYAVLPPDPSQKPLAAFSIAGPLREDGTQVPGTERPVCISCGKPVR